jgi:5-deoxy-glucuronate isomerase
MKVNYGGRFFEQLSDEPGMNSIKENPFTVLDFGLLVLEAGGSHRFQTDTREYAIDILSGTATIKVGKTTFSSIGGRSSVFAGPPTLVYAGHSEDVTVHAESACEIALGSAPSSTAIEPYLVTPQQVRSGHWGENTTRRYFDYMIDQSKPSERIAIAEVTVSNGNWATYPPHKHEEGGAGEAFQEELYFYKVQPEQGFGFCAQFGGQMPEDFAFPITNNTAHKQPFGYHTVAAAPGYSVCYVAVYAGHDKTHKTAPHPDHAWYAELYERTLRHLRRDFQ